MLNINFIDKIEALPTPADKQKAKLELEALHSYVRQNKSNSADFIDELVQNREGNALLLAIFGNSPYLTQSLKQEPEVIESAVIIGIEGTANRIINNLSKNNIWLSNTDEVNQYLRIAKRQFSLLVAIADISGAWDFYQVVKYLSNFADVCVEVTLSHIIYKASQQGLCAKPSLESPTKDSGITVLGMGKLGAQELNYSSDIDLIVLFDNDRIQWRCSDKIQEDLHRLTRNFVNILSSRTKDGYVFRTDLRLRPDAGTAPLAVSNIAAERYYESLGQNWERAAMIKARYVAGDKIVAHDILKSLEPFIWRKNLDFAAIQDIHSIKRQINAYKGYKDIGVMGHNIKIGRGGIREIEFYAQTQQLIWGGRDSSLRHRATIDSLLALSGAGRANKNAVEDLVNSYLFLRHVEHRLQMISDEQIHTLPTNDEAIRNVAIFSGFENLSDFIESINTSLDSVKIHYSQLFEDSPDLGKSTGNLVFTGTEDDPDTISTLEGMGFNDGSAVATTIRGWHHGKVRATRSIRSRELLTELMPSLLESLSDTVEPDSAFFHFNNFMSNLPSGVQIFSLFYANPSLLSLLAEVMGSAPKLAEILSRRPELLDGLLTGDFYEPLKDLDELVFDLETKTSSSDDYEQILNITRRWSLENQFQVGMQILRGLVDGNSSGLALSNIAESVVKVLLPKVEVEFRKHHGIINGGSIAIVSMGKLGGKELTFLSDLDLIFIYTSPNGLNSLSDGKTPLPASQYYGRLSNRFISAISSLTSEGRLYEVDTRLRPSGKAGPIASEIIGFDKYQNYDAWTWEHMALTRARVIAGPVKLKNHINTIIIRTLTKKRDINILLRDVSEMRIRIDDERKTDNPWKLQHVRGGLLDIEFILQYLQLKHAYKYPNLLSSNSKELLLRLVDYGILQNNEATDLIDAISCYRKIQGLLRLTVGMNRDTSKYPKALRERLTKLIEGANNYSEVESKLLELQSHILQNYYKKFIN